MTERRRPEPAQPVWHERPGTLALASIGVHYRPWQVAEYLRYPTPFAALAAQLQSLLDDSDQVGSHSPRLIEIPVCYGGEFGPDLAAAAADCGMSEAELIALHGAEGG